MSNDGTERPLITPPPGIIRSAASQHEPETVDADDEAEFISLPPGVSVPDLDSGTHRLTNPRRGRTTAVGADGGDAEASAPVFFPTGAPGMPVPSPASPVAAPPAPDTRAEPAEPTGPVATQATSTQSTPAGSAQAAPERPATDAATTDAGRAVWTLRLADGSTLPLTSTTIVGRRPAAVDRWPDARLLPLADESRSISKTHAALVLDTSGSLTLWDLNSTNGTFLEHPGGAEVEVLAGAPVTVPPGSVLGFGEYSATAERA